MKSVLAKVVIALTWLLAGIPMTANGQLPAHTIIEAQHIPACPAAVLTQYNFVKANLEGLWVSNPTNEDIGYPKAFYDGWKNYYWIPVNGKKMSVCGRYYRFSIYDGESGVLTGGNDSHDDEYDWNITLVPHAPFNYIIENVYAISKTTNDWQTGTFDGKTYTAIQAEITPDESLYNNPWFPNIGHEQSTTNVVSPTIGVYGPWVMDNNHNKRPEIHPCEIIWWRKKLGQQEEYYIFGIQDDSNRFDEPGDFVFDHNFGLQWKPWAKPPMTAQFKIPFEYNGQFSDHLVVNIEELRSRHVVTANFSEGADSDDGNSHQLSLKQFGIKGEAVAANKPSGIMVQVNENIPNPADLGIKFVDLHKKADGTIIGYIQIFTAYGKNVSGQEGYHAIKVTMNYPKNRILSPVKNPGTWPTKGNKRKGQ